MAEREITTNTSITLTPTVVAGIENFTASLLAADPMVAYERAKLAMETSEATQALLKQYAVAQSEFRQQQARGTLTQDLISRVRQLYDQVQADPRIAAFIRAQLEARTFLDEMTEELGKGLSVDFSSLANVTSSCCS